MPHVFAIAAGAVSLYCAYRWVSREAVRVEAALDRTSRRIRRNPNHVTTLAFDPATGVYRPVE